MQMCIVSKARCDVRASTRGHGQTAGVGDGGYLECLNGWLAGDGNRVTVTVCAAWHEDQAARVMIASWFPGQALVEGERTDA